MFMVRPSEFVDLRTTCVTVERELLERAKSEGVNISSVLRKALKSHFGEPRGKVDRRLKKFKGLPRHIVNKAKSNVIANIKNAPHTVEWLNREFGVNCTVSDVSALVPLF